MKKFAATLLIGAAAFALSACTNTAQNTDTGSNKTIAKQKQTLAHCQELKRQMMMVNINAQTNDTSRDARTASIQREYNKLGCDT